MDLQAVKEMAARAEELRLRIREEQEREMYRDPVLGSGKHKESRCSQVPMGYLAWMVQQAWCDERVKVWYEQQSRP